MAYLHFSVGVGGLVTMQSFDGVTTKSLSTGLSLAAGVFHIFRIDISDPTNVRFFIDGTEYNTPFQIPFAATGALAILQPYQGVYKASGVGVATLRLDAVPATMNRAKAAMAEIDVISATIPAGAGGISGEIDIGNKSLVALVLPAGWLAAAGGITFQMNPGDGNFYEVFTAAGSAFALAYTAAGAVCILVDPTTLRGAVAIKIRSGTSGAPVNQTGAPVLQLVTRLAV